MTALNPSQPRKTVGLDTYQTKPAVMSIFDFSAEALGELKTWLEQNPPLLPVTQLIGFSQFTAQASTDSTAVSESSTSGPSTPGLSNLPDGQYVILWGCEAYSTKEGDIAAMGISLNGSAFDFGLCASTKTVDAVSVASGSVQTLKNNGSNSIASVYFGLGSDGATGTFDRRWLIALKFANS